MTKSNKSMTSNPYDLSNSNRPKLKSLDPFAAAIIRKQIEALERMSGTKTKEN